MEPARLPLQSAKRQLSISSLSAQQVQQKRDLDRKAQRAMRERTKARIQVLEDDLARLKASCSQGEQSMLAEIQYLRDQNQRLKSSLESIGRFAFEGISQSNESIPTQKISTGSNTAVPETASTLLNSSDQGTGTQNRMSHAETARQPRAIPPVGGNDGALEQDQQPLNPINSGLGTVAGDASSSGDPEILVSNLVLADGRFPTDLADPQRWAVHTESLSRPTVYPDVVNPSSVPSNQQCRISLHRAQHCSSPHSDWRYEGNFTGPP